ncbi:hypothetical protein DFQ01_121105 [Paenibacillus cellulosilyticus]|uniref:DUF3102 family protein n=1 Tax=Paenibacillus cellulosilyticus TaxID=375489 RepID=A0A2V2YNR7_9BACL|nr:DUF3102 domain-containing protein [Paenibacillus cellulosilyticus]PWV97461.1 hypothetical protein DFQ01_121105 [Paenibacillus cellulosilyticus]QKS48502.1 DUF3102 domain-containing protein [Paenibacillus cellulosilyticus]
MSQLIDRTPLLIAAEIRSIDAQTREIVLRSAIEIGNKLNEAKALVAHGEWGQWLNDNVNYSQSTANNFMKVSVEYGSNYQALENLSYTQAVALLTVPADEREQFAADVNAAELSTRELQAAVKARQAAEKQAKKLESELNKVQTQAEADRNKLQTRVEQLQDELIDARITGSSSDVDKVHAELAEAQAAVKRLEAELKAKPIETTATVEVIPPGIEAELAELRKKVAQPTSVATVKFRIQFDALVEGFKGLLTTLGDVEVTDPEQHQKYVGAVSGLLGKMSEQL